MLYLARKLTDNQEILKTIWYSPVQPYVDYCDVVLGLLQNTWTYKLRIRSARSIMYSIAHLLDMQYVQNPTVLLAANSVSFHNKVEERWYW